VTCGCNLSVFDDFGVERSGRAVSRSQVTGRTPPAMMGAWQWLQQCNKLLRAQTTNYATNWWILTVFFISVSFEVVWTSPIYRGIRSSVARLGAHPMAVTVKQSRW
jgi:hypothetical protein